MEQKDKGEMASKAKPLNLDPNRFKVYSAHELGRRLLQGPDSTVLTHGFVNDYVGIHIHERQVIQYDCNGGHVGTYDVYQDAIKDPPGFATAKSDPFKVIVISPNPFMETLAATPHPIEEPE